MKQAALLIPIYEPEAIALPFLLKFKRDDFARFVVINDGSSSSYDEIFDAIAKETVFEVFSYEGNKGKGYALKYGIRLLKEEGAYDCIVTADGDGQHAYEDILAVKDACLSKEDTLVLGTRVFDKKNVPMASKIGQFLANAAVYFKTKQKISDTQTGLRGLPACLYDLALETPGNRYDYEHDFLMEAAKKTKIECVDIKAIYIDKNAASHFRPVRDTVIIHKRAVSTLLACLATYSLNLLLFFGFVSVPVQGYPLAMIYSATISAGFLAAGGLFFILFFVVFDKRRPRYRNVFKFVSILAFHLLVSSSLIYALSVAPLHLVLVKFIVDVPLFVLDYLFVVLFRHAKRKETK